MQNCAGGRSEQGKLETVSSTPGAPGPLHLGTRETTKLLRANSERLPHRRCLPHRRWLGAPGPLHLGTRETTKLLRANSERLPHRRCWFYMPCAGATARAISVPYFNLKSCFEVETNTPESWSVTLLCMSMPGRAPISSTASGWPAQVPVI